MESFDSQINASFHGTGKRRTELSGLFLVTVDRLFRANSFRAVTAWEEDAAIVVCVEYPESDGSWQSMMGIAAAEVRADMQSAAVDFVEQYIDFQVYSSAKPGFKSDYADYLEIVCAEKAPDAIPVIKEVFGRWWTTAAAEIGYWHEHGHVPDWFECLQDVQRVGDTLIYVYREPRHHWKLGEPVILPPTKYGNLDDLLPGKRLQ